MEQSPKKCHSIRTKEFEKALKKSGAQIARLILKQIEQLEYYENNPDKLPDGIKSPEMTSGKMLAKLNRNIYSLEPAHSVRALAHVVQRDGVKVYVWLWGGTHEEYNNKLKIEALNKEEASSNQKFLLIFNPLEKIMIEGKMQNTKVQNTISEEDLLNIENDARFIEKIPVTERTVDFVIQAIGRNPLVTLFLTEEELSNQQIAFYIALTVKEHKHLIQKHLLDETFYEMYFIQKLKSNKIDDKETFINKQYLSSKDKIKEIISMYGDFKMKYIHDDLKDDESIVHYFCEKNKINQIWASDRIKELAKETGIEVHKYLKTKLFYDSMDARFEAKSSQKQIKI